MIAAYAPRITVAPNRYGSLRPLPPKWVVIHTSEGAESDNAAEQLAGYLERPGDRPNGRGGTYGSSYHAIADTGLRIIPAVIDARVAFSAPGANTEGLHVVIPGSASQSREQWMTGASRDAIRTVAAYLIDIKARYGIPTERLSALELQAGTRGYCDHATIRDAFGRTTHWDVGPGFPWDILRNDIKDLTPKPPPEQETDMLTAIAAIYSPAAGVGGTNPKSFALLPDGSVRHATGPDFDYVKGAGLPIFAILGDEHYAQCVELDKVWRS